MKQGILKIFIAAVLACSLAPAFAQPAPKDMTKQADEAWDKMKSYTVDKKKDAVAMGGRLVRAADRDIKDLERAAGKASGEAKAQMKKEIQALKESRTQAAGKLREMRKSTADAWDGAKSNFADAYRDLHDGIVKAAAKLK